MLRERLEKQQFSNEYAIVDGVRMHEEHGANFRIPPPIIKRKVGVGQFVELRIDSPRFSVHEEDAAKCSCPSCNGELAKPILRHEQPRSILPLPDQQVPSRGWGEDFWCEVLQRDGDVLLGRIDNPLVENKLHGLGLNDQLLFREENILALHPSHRLEIVSAMRVEELKELAEWLGEQGNA
ncbi:MAG: hypothetical protein AAF483_12640 [Planctomycetota bacterium]